MKLLYEGKAKKVFLLESGLILHEFKDSATAFNGQKKGTIANKGHINATLSALLFKYLADNEVENHFVSFEEPNRLITKRLDMVQLEVVARNIAAGSLSKRLGIDEGTVLPSPITEIYYKNDELGDPLINDDHVRLLNLISEKDLSHIKNIALRVNGLLRNIFIKCNISLVDFKLEFGKEDGRYLLADEISPDTCRLWEITTGEKLDKDRFRQDLGSVEQSYSEILTRVRKVLS